MLAETYLICTENDWYTVNHHNVLEGRSLT